VIFDKKTLIKLAEVDEVATHSALHIYRITIRPTLRSVTEKNYKNTRLQRYNPADRCAEPSKP